MTRRVFDCLIYNGELKVLEIRLHELDKVVDRFVVVESDSTFSGKPKRIEFDPTHPAIAPFAHIIDYVLVSDMPVTENPWDRESWQRNAMLRGITDAADSDLILMSDVDEIPRASVVSAARDDENHNVFFFRLDFYYFYVNFKNIKGSEVNKIWNCAAVRTEAVRLAPQGLRQTIVPGARVFENAGWHFSYLTDEAGVKRKIAAFSHQELNTDMVLSRINISSFVRRGADLYNRPGYQWALTDGSDLPQWLLDNRQHLQTLFCIIESDKHYWHRYTELYENAFRKLGEVARIVEFGVSHGASIRWLLEYFPSAQITGLDILPVQPDWPISERITYRQVDQGDRAAVRAALYQLAGPVDIIIEDGSHIPQHQATLLADCVALLGRAASTFWKTFIHLIHFRRHSRTTAQRAGVGTQMR